ncbi:MAG: methionyl-tRNA formyltransferase [Gemmata sp.]
MQIVMMGTGTFAEPTFEALMRAFGARVVGLVTQPERDAGNRRGSTRQTGKGMANIARGAGVPVAQPESINSPEGLEQLRAMQPDLLVVAAYGQILNPEVLATPTRGTINVHASLLPKYRGAAPVACAILGGETQTGVTIIKVTPGLDSGDMILQEALDILPSDTTGTLEARLAEVGARLAVEAAHKYAAGGPVEGAEQDPALVTKAPKIKKEFGLIDWAKPADHIERFIRAMQPWPTAYTFLHRPGKEPMRVIVSKVGAVRRVTSHCEARPGALVDNATSGFWVRCSFAMPTELLEVLELQPAGKKRMTADEFLRGCPAVEGMRFGPEVLS